MDEKHDDTVRQARLRMVEAGGRVSQDLGMGRIVGEMLICLYLSPAEVSLDDLAAELELSKASASIATRQLESFGLIRRVWKQGDRRSYYRSADNIGLALQQGILSFVRERVLGFGAEMRLALEMLEDARRSEGRHDEADFFRHRVDRAVQLQRRLEKVLKSPLIRYLAVK